MKAEQLLTPAQVAERLSVSSDLVLKAIKGGQLRARKIGTRTIRIEPADVDAWLERCLIEPFGQRRRPRRRASPPRPE